MVAIHRGSRCKDLVDTLAVLKDMIHPAWWQDLAELLARVRSDEDERQARVVIGEVRRNPALFCKPPPSKRIMRKAAKAARDAATAERMKLARAAAKIDRGRLH
jgi:Fic family protein